MRLIAGADTREKAVHLSTKPTLIRYCSRLTLNLTLTRQCKLTVTGWRWNRAHVEWQRLSHGVMTLTLSSS